MIEHAITGRAELIQVGLADFSQSQAQADLAVVGRDQRVLRLGIAIRLRSEGAQEPTDPVRSAAAGCLGRARLRTQPSLFG